MRRLMVVASLLTVMTSSFVLEAPHASAATVTAISSGREFTCALTTAGGVKCWGYNAYGQLGIGTTSGPDGCNPSHPCSKIPVDVVGLTSNVQAISAGVVHACALAVSGGVKCWGANNFGELGDGTNIDRPTPVDVVGLMSGVQAISVGTNHTCALTTVGGVKCWGYNGYGELGDGTTGEGETSPVDVYGLTSGVQAISSGADHTCALTTGGAVQCWGLLPSGYDFLTPIGIYGLTAGVQAISAGSTHDCALTTAGGVKCWGHNDFGELGDGSNAGGPYPVDVSGLSSGVQAIGAGGDDAGNGLGAHTCALLVDGAVKCWGHNFVGEVGDGTTTDRFAPADVSGLSSGVQAISVGGEHTCALLTSGGVSCWGDNFVGEIGDGTDVDRHVPTAVRWPVPKITKVSPKKAKAGTTVLTITGTDLLSTSGVTFNGLPSASFTAASQTTVTALVPAGAKTGKVVVTTADGAAKSPRKLKIK